MTLNKSSINKTMKLVCQLHCCAQRGGLGAWSFPFMIYFCSCIKFLASRKNILNLTEHMTEKIKICKINFLFIFVHWMNICYWDNDFDFFFLSHIFTLVLIIFMRQMIIKLLLYLCKKIRKQKQTIMSIYVIYLVEQTHGNLY